jgi:N-methylhydantoinase A
MRSDYTRTCLMAVDNVDLSLVNATINELEAQARSWLTGQGVTAAQQQLRRAVDMRYRGQNYELTTPLVEGEIGAAEIEALLQSFHQVHERTYGYCSHNEATELVTFRVEAIGIAPKAALNPQRSAAPDSSPAQVSERQVYLGESDGGFVTCPVFQRHLLHPGHRLMGPAIIEQMDSTTLILPQQQATIDPYHTIIIAVDGDSPIA